MQHFKGLRIITNLHCNFDCRFCYQKNKTPKVLGVQELAKAIRPYINPDEPYFEYCTIMGGESTLLPNLSEYILRGSCVSRQTRLTTNGSLVTPEKLTFWKSCGLDGINISIPTLGQDYGEVTGSSKKVSHALRIVHLAVNEFGTDQIRINIPLCRANLDGHRLEDLLHTFLFAFGIKVTLCEDMLHTYTVMDKLDQYGLKLVNDTGYGLVMLDYKGKELGCYTHKDNYKGTDLIVSPVGIFVGWDDYCQTVGLNPNH